MKISFRGTLRDQLAFIYYHLTHSPLSYGLLAFILLIGIRPNWRAMMKVAAGKSLFIQIFTFTVSELVPVLICIVGVAILMP